MWLKWIFVHAFRHVWCSVWVTCNFSLSPLGRNCEGKGLKERRCGSKAQRSEGETSHSRPCNLVLLPSPLSLLSNALLIIHMVILSPITPLIYKKEIILKIPPTQIIRLSTYMIYKKFNRSETEMWPLHTCNQYHVKSTKYTLYK